MAEFFKIHDVDGELPAPGGGGRGQGLEDFLNPPGVEQQGQQEIGRQSGQEVLDGLPKAAAIRRGAPVFPVEIPEIKGDEIHGLVSFQLRSVIVHLGSIR